MAVGDEIGLTEDLYMSMIGRYVATIEVLSKRLVAKDQHIARLETQLANKEAKGAEPREGEIIYVDPSELDSPASKKKK